MLLLRLTAAAAAADNAVRALQTTWKAERMFLLWGLHQMQVPTNTEHIQNAQCCSLAHAHAAAAEHLLLLLHIRCHVSAASHLDVKGAVCWVQLLRPADECHPRLLSVAECERAAGILGVSHLAAQSSKDRRSRQRQTESQQAHGKKEWMGRQRKSKANAAGILRVSYLGAQSADSQEQRGN
jgi:hypothetical protein